MFIRATTLALAATLLLAACGSSDDIPSDQKIKPTAAPSDWKTTDLGPVTLMTPPGWARQETQTLTATVKSTTWRAAPDASGTSAAGAEVRVISKPQQSAAKAAQSLAINAMAKLQSGKSDPVEIVWPGAKKAYLLEYTAKVGATGKEKPFPTKTIVFDLENGGQVQVTSLAGDGPDAKAPAQVLGSVELGT